MAYCYVLKCKKDNSYYIGSTKDIIARLKTHQKGEVKYTKSRLPVELIFLKEFPNYNDAFQFERRVKSWKKRKSIEKMLEKSDNIASKYWEIV